MFVPFTLALCTPRNSWKQNPKVAEFREGWLRCERPCSLEALHSEHQTLLIKNYRRESESANDSAFLLPKNICFLHTFPSLLYFVFLACEENTSQKGGISVLSPFCYMCTLLNKKSLACLCCVEMLLLVH